MVFTTGTKYADLPPESDTLAPLPWVLRHGLNAVVVLSSISLISSFLLLSHLTYKLTQHMIKRRRWKPSPPKRITSPIDLSLGLDEAHFGATPPAVQRASSPDRGGEMKEYPPPNQFVLLLYNLLLADIHQSIAFFLNVVWVVDDGILVRSPACWAQGWFISNGDLASSCFIFSIALHTYLTVVREHRPSQWALNAWIVGTWVFVYGTSIAGVAGTNNGEEAGGYFVRASAWCWINQDYERLRLVTHYLYIFLAIVFTSLLYVIIFLSLRRRLSSSQNASKLTSSWPHRHERPSLRHKGSMLSLMSSSSARSPSATRSDHHMHPAFLVYPVIYVICTLPLAMGRIATMAGADVPLGYFCAAGALITSNGWLDVLLWGTTRRSIVFGPVDNADALGLETFNLMRTPPNRQFGNIVWVQGATDLEPGDTGRRPRGSRTWWARSDGFFGRGGAGDGNGDGLWDDRDSGIPGRLDRQDRYRMNRERSSYVSSLRFNSWEALPDLGMTIKMDRVVTVAQVDKRELESGTSTPDTSLGDSISSYSAGHPENDGYF